MRIVLLSLMSVTLSAAAFGQEASSKAATSADKFSIDIPADDAVSAPPVDPVTTPAPEPTATDSSSIPAAATAAGTFSLDTPIADLIADPRAKAVLDKNLPGISTDENLDKFRAMSLRQFAPLTGGQLTSALLNQTALDLAAVTAGDAPSLSPRRGKMTGR